MGFDASAAEVAVNDCLRRSDLYAHHEDWYELWEDVRDMYVAEKTWPLTKTPAWTFALIRDTLSEHYRDEYTVAVPWPGEDV